MLSVRPHGLTPCSTSRVRDPLLCHLGGLGPQKQAHRRPLGCLLSGCAHHKDLGLGESTVLPRAQVCQDLCSCRLTPPPPSPGMEPGTAAEGSPTPQLPLTPPSAPPTQGHLALRTQQNPGPPSESCLADEGAGGAGGGPLCMPAAERPAEVLGWDRMGGCSVSTPLLLSFGVPSAW